MKNTAGSGEDVDSENDHHWVVKRAADNGGRVRIAKPIEGKSGER
jgi:hypothetical protein